MELLVADTLGWRLRGPNGVVTEHRFDTLYVDWDPWLYVAPDGTQAIVVATLHTGWVTESAVYPVRLARLAP